MAYSVAVHACTSSIQVGSGASRSRPPRLQPLISMTSIVRHLSSLQLTSTLSLASSRIHQEAIALINAAYNARLLIVKLMSLLTLFIFVIQSLELNSLSASPRRLTKSELLNPIADNRQILLLAASLIQTVAILVLMFGGGPGNPGAPAPAAPQPAPQAAPGAGRARLARVPDAPSWGPNGRKTFKQWTQELMFWSVLAVELDPAQQTAAIVSQLHGEAKALAHTLTYNDITVGGMVNGVHLDPMTYLLTQLAAAFAPLGEESRLAQIKELMEFRRNQGESTDALITRFRQVRWTTVQGQAGLTMSWEGYTWLLVKAVGPKPEQLMQLLQPTNGRFPATEAEFDHMCMLIRRMSHVIENAPGNIAATIRGGHGSAFPTWGQPASSSNSPPMHFPAVAPDPWQDQQHDPWGQSPFQQVPSYSQPSYPAHPPNQNPSPNPWSNWQQSPPSPAPSEYQQSYGGQTFASFEQDDDTDTDTASSYGAPLDYNAPDLVNLTPAQQDEHLYWTYTSAKSRWRRHMQKPVRKVRKFFKRKGKGRGKGRRRFSFLAEASDEVISDVFFGGKGKGKRRTTGKGKGSRKNPTGADGATMLCGICGADDHFRAVCPRNASSGKGGTNFLTAPVPALTDGPLSEVLEGSSHPTALCGFVHRHATPYSLDTVYPEQLQPSAFYAPALESPYTEDLNHLRSQEIQLPYETLQHMATAIRNQPENITHAELGRVIAARQTVVNEVVASAMPAPTVFPYNPQMPELPSLFEQFPALATFGNQQALRDRISRRPDVHPTEPPAPAHFYRGDVPSTANYPVPLNQLVAVDQNTIGASINSLSAHQARRTDPETVARRQQAAQELARLITSGMLHRATLVSGQQYVPPNAENPPRPVELQSVNRAQSIGSDRARSIISAAQIAVSQSDDYSPERSLARDTPEGSPQRTPAVAAERPACCICQEEYEQIDTVVVLDCRHHYHKDCCDSWSAALLSQEQQLTCPQCRADLRVATTGPAYDSVDTPPVAEQAAQWSRNSFSNLTQSQYPIWPATIGQALNPAVPETRDSLAYHTSTQLASGEASLIVDPGAYTSLIGKQLAIKLATRAQANGQPVSQERLQVPVEVAGVGNGAQTCKFRIRATIATPLSDGSTQLHEWTAPIVEGEGENIPGLLGMDSLSRNRAILNMGDRKELIYPGPGEVKLVLPPGSKVFPLKESPSGHLCLPVDGYEKVSRKPPGGISRPIPTLAAHEPQVEEQLQSSFPSTVCDAGVRVPVSGIEILPQTANRKTRRALVVEETPAVSVLFASQGLTPETYSPHSITKHCDEVIGRIRSSVYEYVWMNLPLSKASLPTTKSMNTYHRMISNIFRVAVLIGIFVCICGPRGRRWSDESITSLKTDGIAYETHHKYCAANIRISTGDTRPSNATLVMLSPKDSGVYPTVCKCGNVEHQSDVERSRGRPHSYLQRATAFAQMSQYVASTVVRPSSRVTRHLQQNLNVQNLNVHFQERQTEHQSQSENRSNQCFPTESAERAKERKKELKAAGKTPNRKHRIVEEHYDDLGDDLSGLGGDISYLSAEVTNNSWSESEGDDSLNEMSEILRTIRPPLTFNDTKSLAAWSLQSTSTPLKIVELAAHAISMFYHTSDGGAMTATAPFTIDDQDALLNHLQQRPSELIIVTSPQPLNSNRLGTFIAQAARNGTKYWIMTPVEHNWPLPPAWHHLFESTSAVKAMFVKNERLCCFTNAQQFKDIAPVSTCYKVPVNNTRLWSHKMHDYFAQGLYSLFMVDRRIDPTLCYPCDGCVSNISKFHRVHNRVPGECRFHDVPSTSWEPEWTCPGCNYRTENGRLKIQPRGHPSHVDDETCRWTIVPERSGKNMRRTPHPRDASIPAEEDPDANASVGDLPDYPPEPIPPVATSSSSSSSSAHPPIPAPPTPRRRGPDTIPRHGEEAPLMQDTSQSDWTRFNVDKSLRVLRTGTPQQKLKEVRKLHLRWWHATRSAMERIFTAAGLPTEVIEMIRNVIATCRSCRPWQAPAPQVTQSVNITEKPNEVIEADILFYHEFLVWHMIDRCDRWHAACQIVDKHSLTLQEAIDLTWIQIHGPFKTLVVDGETGISSESTKAWLLRLGIHIQPRAKNQHARMIERRGAILRHCLHTTNEQLQKEGVEVSFKSLLAQCTFAGNALVNIGGASPYQARFGYTPAILPDLLTSDSDESPIMHRQRMREVALEKMINATAVERINRAMKTATRIPGEVMDYKPGELVDFYTPSGSSDTSGWRGPAEIIESVPAEGNVQLRWKSQRLIRRFGDVRRFIDFRALVFGVLHANSSGRESYLVVEKHLQKMRPQTYLTIGFIYENQTWAPTQTVHKHQDLALALQFLITNVLQVQGVVNTRLGRAIRRFPEAKGFATTTTIWWKQSLENCQIAEKAHSGAVYTPECVGEDWDQYKYLQLLLQPHATIDLNALLDPDLSAPSESISAAQSTLDPLETHRLSTIDEGTETSLFNASRGNTSAAVEAGVRVPDSGIEILPTDMAEEQDPSDEVGVRVPDSGIEILPLEEYYDMELFATLSEQQRVFLAGLPLEPCLVDDTAALPEPVNTSYYTFSDDCYFSEELAVDDSMSHNELEYDAAGNPYVDILFEGEHSKLIIDKPVPEGYTARLRTYLNQPVKTAVVERDTDILTNDEWNIHRKAINVAMADELKIWIQHECFKIIPRQGSRNILDVRWVCKWKYIKDPQNPSKMKRIIRMRMTQRGFKDADAENLLTFAGTSSRISQRIVVSEAVIRQWTITAVDIKKAFLKGITYQELSELTGEPLREVNFELSRDAAAVLKTLPGFEHYDQHLHVLQNIKPGTGTKDAPRCFAIKLQRAMSYFGAKPTTHDPQLVVRHTQGELDFIATMHVDDVKVAASTPVFEQFIRDLETVFGSGELEITRENFTCCGMRHTKTPLGYELDQIEYMNALKPITDASITGQPDNKLAEQRPAKLFLSLLMAFAYTLMTRIDVSVYVIALQKHLQTPTYGHIKKLNTLVRWSQNKPMKMVYKTMKCLRQLEAHSDTGFRRENDKEGLVDGKAMRGINIFRLGPEHNGTVQVHLLDVLCGAVKVVVRSTFSAETHGVITAVDMSIVVATILHEVTLGPLPLLESKRLTDEHGLAFKIVCVTDAKNILLALGNTNIKNPAEKNFLVHLLWLRDKLVTGVVSALQWCDTRDMTADGHTKGTIRRNALHEAMQGIMKMTYKRETLILYEPRNTLCVFYCSWSGVSPRPAFLLPADPPLFDFRPTTETHVETACVPRLSFCRLQTLQPSRPHTLQLSLPYTLQLSLPSSLQLSLPFTSQLTLPHFAELDRQRAMPRFPSRPSQNSAITPTDNPWDVLGFATPSFDDSLSEPSPAALKDAYRRLLLVWHPDRCQDPALIPSHTLQTQKINEAMEILSDPISREAWARVVCISNDDTLPTKEEMATRRVLPGNAQLQSYILKRFLQEQRSAKQGSRKSSNSAACFAFLQVRALFKFNGKVIPTTLGRTTRDTYIKAKQEIYEAATSIHVIQKRELMKKNIRKRAIETSQLPRAGQKWTVKQITRAATKWRRAAVNRLTFTLAAAKERQAHRASEAFEETTIENEWKVFRQRTRSAFGASNIPRECTAAVPKHTFKRSSQQKTKVKQRVFNKRQERRDNRHQGAASASGSNTIKKALPPVPRFTGSPEPSVLPGKLSRKQRSIVRARTKFQLDTHALEKRHDAASKTIEATKLPIGAKPPSAEDPGKVRVPARGSRIRSKGQGPAKKPPAPNITACLTENPSKPGVYSASAAQRRRLELFGPRHQPEGFEEPEPMILNASGQIRSIPLDNPFHPKTKEQIADDLKQFKFAPANDEELQWYHVDNLKKHIIAECGRCHENNITVLGKYRGSTGTHLCESCYGRALHLDDKICRQHEYDVDEGNMPEYVPITHKPETLQLVPRNTPAIVAQRARWAEEAITQAATPEAKSRVEAIRLEIFGPAKETPLPSGSTDAAQPEPAPAAGDAGVRVPVSGIEILPPAAVPAPAVDDAEPAPPRTDVAEETYQWLHDWSGTYEPTMSPSTRAELPSPATTSVIPSIAATSVADPSIAATSIAEPSQLSRREEEILAELGSPLSETPTPAPLAESQQLGRELFNISNKSDFTEHLRRISLLGENHRAPNEYCLLDEDSLSPIRTESEGDEEHASDDSLSSLDLGDEYCPRSAKPLQIEKDAELDAIEYNRKTIAKFSQGDGRAFEGFLTRAMREQFKYEEARSVTDGGFATPRRTPCPPPMIGDSHWPAGTPTCIRLQWNNYCTALERGALLPEAICDPDVLIAAQEEEVDYSPLRSPDESGSPIRSPGLEHELELDYPPDDQPPVVSSSFRPKSSPAYPVQLSPSPVDVEDPLPIVESVRLPSAASAQQPSTPPTEEHSPSVAAAPSCDDGAPETPPETSSEVVQPAMIPLASTRSERVKQLSAFHEDNQRTMIATHGPRKDPFNYRREANAIIGSQEEHQQISRTINKTVPDETLAKHDPRFIPCNHPECLLAVDSSQNPTRANVLCTICGEHPRCRRCAYAQDRYRHLTCEQCKRTAHLTCGMIIPGTDDFYCNKCKGAVSDSLAASSSSAGPVVIAYDPAPPASCISGPSTLTTATSDIHHSEARAGLRLDVLKEEAVKRRSGAKSSSESRSPKRQRPRRVKGKAPARKASASSLPPVTEVRLPSSPKAVLKAAPAAKAVLKAVPAAILLAREIAAAAKARRSRTATRSPPRSKPSKPKGPKAAAAGVRVPVSGIEILPAARVPIGSAPAKAVLVARQPIGMGMSPPPKPVAISVAASSKAASSTASSTPSFPKPKPAGKVPSRSRTPSSAKQPPRHPDDAGEDDDPSSSRISTNAPRGRCNLCCDICGIKPCARRDNHPNSGPPNFGGCRCAAALRNPAVYCGPPQQPPPPPLKAPPRTPPTKRPPPTMKRATSASVTRPAQKAGMIPKTASRDTGTGDIIR